MPIRAAAWIAILLGIAAFHPASAHEIDAGAGVLIPLDGDNRDAFGAAPLVSGGVALELNPGRTWAVLEAAWHGDTDGSFPQDPTFTLPEPRVSFVPLLVAIRGNLVPQRIQGRVAFTAGIGIHTLFARYRDVNRNTTDGVGFGLHLELGPRVQISPRWALWARQSLRLSTDIDFGLNDINPSGVGFQGGLSYRVGGAS